MQKPQTGTEALKFLRSQRTARALYEMRYRKKHRLRLRRYQRLYQRQRRKRMKDGTWHTRGRQR